VLPKAGTRTAYSLAKLPRQSCSVMKQRQKAPMVMTSFKHLGLCIIAAGLTLGSATAQTATSDPNPAGQNSNTTSTRTDDRRGFDYGWLGLLGLAGLAGLRKREAPDRLHHTASSRA
jgi:MYXO-CTERM domain-containing protein